MRVLILLFVFLLSFNLMALSQIRPMNTNSDFIENKPNQISVMEKSKPFTKSIITNYAIKPDQELNVYNLNGSIRFVGWDQNYVKITAIKKSFKNCCDLDKIQMILNTLNGLNIETVNISNDDRAGIDYIINIPQNTLIGEIYTRKSIKFNNLPNNVVDRTRRLSNR